MASNVNEKVYTDHALMDEVVFHTKTILSGIVLKNETTANENETAQSITESDYYISCVNGTIELSYFPLTVQWLMDYGYHYKDAIKYVHDWTLIPESDRDDLLNYLTKRYIDEYEEKNNYYRALIGLPEYGTDAYDIILDKDTLDYVRIADDYNTDFPETAPIHTYNNKQLNVLRGLGIIDELIEEHFGDNHYKYLNYLGGLSIDLYSARIAANWDILYIPNCENLVRNRFKEIYAINRDIYIKRTYQQAYSWMSDYYDEMVMIMTLSQTFADLIAELPEWYIRRDIFDLRSAQYFLESQGVKFFKEIPLKWQIKLVKNLNRLIKYKSTNINIHDILEIFAVPGTEVYKYYLYKDYLPASTNFDLKFVKTPIDESYDQYIRNPMYLVDYDAVTTSSIDKYWDGDLDHSLVKQQHSDKDFSIEGTKYMFLDYSINITEYQFQICYFMGLIFNSKVDTEDITLMVPTISSESYYSIEDLCILLVCLSGPYLGRKLKVHIPMIEDDSEWVMADRYDFGDQETDFINFEPALGGEKYDFGYNYEPNPRWPYNRYDFNEELEGVDYQNPSPDNVDYDSSSLGLTDDWLRDNYPYMWKYTKWMIYGFNLQVDLQKLEEDISVRHSAFGFEGSYTLADFGCDTFIATDSISSVEQLNDVYMNNKACYDNIMKFFKEDCDTRDKAVVAQYVFDNLFLTDFDLEFYRLKSGQIATDYIEVLQEKNYSLYKFYMNLISESDLETQKDTIRTVLNDIVTTLEYFIGNQQNLQFLFSFVPTSSPEAIIQYISLVINFFKSWKVYFLDPTSSFIVVDSSDYQSRMHDNMNEICYEYWKDDHNLMRDAIQSTVQLYFTEDVHALRKEVVEIYGYFSIDPDFDNVYDGWYPDTDTTGAVNVGGDGGTVDNCIPYNMVNGGTPYGIGLFDTITLDGGPVYDQHDYKDINGYLVSDPAGKLYGNDLELIGYPIFGGYPGKLWSDSISTNISELLEVSNNVIISSRYINNALVAEPDGLYFGNGVGDYVTRADYDQFEVELDYADGTLIPLGYYYLEWLKLFSSEDYMDKQLDNAFKRIMRPLIDITDPSSSLFDPIKEYLEYRIYQFNTWFDSINPFDWERFNE